MLRDLMELLKAAAVVGFLLWFFSWPEMPFHPLVKRGALGLVLLGAFLWVCWYVVKHAT